MTENPYEKYRNIAAIYIATMMSSHEIADLIQQLVVQTDSANHWQEEYNKLKGPQK